jgi:hypothetical protein
MQALEQHQTTDRSQHPCPLPSGLHEVHKETWGPGAARPERQQPSNAMDQFGQFCIGFGDGITHFVTDAAQTASKAVTHPSETIHSAVEGTKGAIKATTEAVIAGSAYVGEKVSHGDYAGMANDGLHTGEAIKAGIVQSVDHFNHLTAKEKGYIFGHDVAPTVIGTIIAPELIPEGAAAAACGKVVSTVGTVIKEEGVIGKVGSVFETAREKITAMSSRIADLNEKMAGLAERNGLKSSIKHSELLPHGDGFPELGPRVEPTPEFVKAVEKAKETIGVREANDLKNVEIIPSGRVADELGVKHSRAAAAFKEATETEPAKIYVGENHWHGGSWVQNEDVTFRSIMKSDMLAMSSLTQAAFQTDRNSFQRSKKTGQRSRSSIHTRCISRLLAAIK